MTNKMKATLGFASELKCQPKKSIKGIEGSQLKSINELHGNLLTYIEDVPDPRVKRTQKHFLKDILTIAILAVIGGADGWEDIENYGIAKKKWLSEFLELPNGIPSDDTFRRVFEKIAPQVLEECLAKWVRGMVSSLDGKIIPVDGKTIKGSYDRERGLKALHLVTAWASEQRLILGQIKVEDSSNERNYGNSRVIRIIRHYWSNRYY